MNPRYTYLLVDDTRITVKYADRNFRRKSLPVWEAWITGNKKSTFKFFRGSTFNAVNTQGFCHQSPRLVAETFKRSLQSTSTPKG